MNSRNLSTTTAQEVNDYQKRCDMILLDPRIRFAGIINQLGNIVAGGFKKGVEPFEKDPNMRKLYMQLALRVSMRRDFDYSMGDVEYTFSRRKKLVMMSFPLDNKVLLVALETCINPESYANKILRILHGP